MGKKIAIQAQLWDNANLENDFTPIFNEILEAGYDGVECRFTVMKQKSKLKDYLKDHSLTLLGLHAHPSVFIENGELKNEFYSLLHDMKEFHIPFLLVSGHPTPTQEAQLSLVKSLSILADECQKNNIQLVYHNHDFEFANGYELFDRIIDNQNIGIALDIGWLYRANYPLDEFISKYTNQIKYFHIKDTTKKEWKELGTGTVDIVKAIATIESIAMEWWTVEQDDSVLPPFESANKSREFLTKLGY